MITILHKGGGVSRDYVICARPLRMRRPGMTNKRTKTKSMKDTVELETETKTKALGAI